MIQAFDIHEPSLKIIGIGAYYAVSMYNYVVTNNTVVVDRNPPGMDEAVTSNGYIITNKHIWLNNSSLADSCSRTYLRCRGFEWAVKLNKRDVCCKRIVMND